MLSPKSWSNVSYRQFLDLGSLNKSDYPNQTDYNIDMLSIICDVDVEEVENLNYSDFLTLEKSLKWTAQTPKGYNDALVNFNLISLGQFIDVEHFISDINELPNVTSILLGRMPIDEVLKMPCDEVVNIIPAYLLFREQIIKAYANIFAPQFENNEDTSGYTAEDFKEIEDEKKASSHSWEKFILSCCNDDMTKFEAVTEMNLILVFNLYSAR